MVDLRSDTVTRPTERMRRAMASAEVGDDVLGDDPTVNRLEARCAELTGTEAALFVPSGSMGNLVSLAALTRASEEVLCDAEAHFVTQEGGGVALLGVIPRAVCADTGRLGSDALAAAIRPGDDHSPRTAAVVVENTHTRHHGRVAPVEAQREIAAVCRAAGVAVHVDGARIFNAQVATGTPVAAWAEAADTLTFCFSKGLGAPAGSMVCGARETIARARIVRKRLGGAMRQAGVLAAAAEVALDTEVERLADDHARARRLAEEIHAMSPTAVDPDAVETNIVYANVGAAPDVVTALEREGVLARAVDRDTIRLVTHRDVGDRDLDHAVSALRRALSEAEQRPR